MRIRKKILQSFPRSHSSVLVLRGWVQPFQTSPEPHGPLLHSRTALTRPHTRLLTLGADHATPPARPQSRAQRSHGVGERTCIQGDTSGASVSKLR